VKCLIEFGAGINKEICHRLDVNKKNKDGEVPLFNPYGSGNKKSIEYLIEHGTGIDIINKNGNTAKDVSHLLLY